MHSAITSQIGFQQSVTDSRDAELKRETLGGNKGRNRSGCVSGGGGGGGWDFKDERVRVTTLSGMLLSAWANICSRILLFPLLLFAVDREE